MTSTPLGKKPKSELTSTSDQDSYLKYRSLADQGDPNAQYEIGKCYRCGVGVNEDISQAIEWFSRAGAQQHQGAHDVLKELAANPPLDDTNSVFALGKLFHIGYGVTWNQPMAIQLYELASELGHRDAPYYLGFIYDDWRRDVKKALHYYRVASSRGHEIAEILHSLSTCSTPFSEGSAIVYAGDLEAQKDVWLHKAYRLVNDASYTGFQPAWYEFLSSLLRTCIEQENLDAWVPLANKKAQTALAYFFLGTTDYIAEWLPASQIFVKTALAFAWADSELIPDASFEQKFQYLLNLKPIFSKNPYKEKLEEAFSDCNVDFALQDHALNKVMYMRGDLFAKLWGAKNLACPPDTEILGQCIKDINRTSHNRVIDPGGAVSALMSLVSSFSPADDEGFFMRHRRYFRETLFRNFPFSADILSSHGCKDVLDWGLISDNRFIQWSKTLIGDFSDELDLKTLSGNPSVEWGSDLIHDYEQWISNRFESWLPWDVLSANPSLKLTTEIIQLYADQIDWKCACKYLDKCLLNLMFRKYPELIEWGSVSRSERINWDEELIDQFQDYWDWGGLGINATVPWFDGLYSKYQDRINWATFSNNPNMPWSVDFVESHGDKIDWVAFSANPGTFWNEKLIDRFSEQIDFSWLSRNKAVPWTEDLIRSYESKLDWRLLSSNPALPWSEEFIRRHENRLMWKENEEPLSFVYGPGLSGNSALPWSHSFFDEHSEHLNVVEVAKVYSGCVENLSPESIKRLLNKIG